MSAEQEPTGHVRDLDETSPPVGDEVGLLSLRLQHCTTDNPADAQGHGSDGRPSEVATVRNDTELCKPCSELDFGEIFRKTDAQLFEMHYVDGRVLESYLQSGIFVADLGDRPTNPGTCPLCSFFGSVAMGQGPYWLCAFSSVIDNSAINISIDPTHAIGRYQNAFLAVIPVPQKPDHLYLPFRESNSNPWHPVYRALQPPTREPPGFWARWLAHGVDFDLARYWLAFCRKHHRGACVRTKRRTPRNLQGFRLIDCESESLDVLDSAPTESYAALSYVWGDEAAAPPAVTWPQVILDAVLATKRLGLRYLWVDRVCIDQGDAKTKHLLISKMDVIYRNAEVTIIDAASSNACRGLPGVGATPRERQPKIRVGDTLLASPLQDCRRDIYKSTWWTRGWTYQEGVLARRRLVFTQNQIYWECASMVTWEAMHLPLESCHTKRRMGKHMAAGVFGGAPREEYRNNHYHWQSEGVDWKESLSQALQHIAHFSKRQLKYSTDSLLAMQGILKHYSATNFKLAFFYGVPILSGLFKDGRLEDPRRASFAAALPSWYHTKRNPRGVQRLGHLPSWTWAGWQGEVEWMHYYHDIRRILRDGWAADIHLRRRTGAAAALADLSRDNLHDEDFDGTLLVSQPYVLDCTGLRFSRDHYTQAYDWSAALDKYYRGGVRLCLSTSQALGEPLEADHWRRSIKEEVLLVLVALTSSVPKEGKFLVLVPAASSSHPGLTCYERVGTASLAVLLPATQRMTPENVMKRYPLRRMSTEIAIC